MYFMDKQTNYQTAELGNRLRSSAEQVRKQYVDEATAVARSMIDDLTKTIELTDLQLVELTRAY